MADRELTPKEIAANVAKAEAEAAKAKAETEKLRFEAERARYDAETILIELERERHKRSKELASDEHHHVYRFADGVTANSVEKCMAQLTAWHRLPHEGKKPCAMTIIFNSPGGSVISGMALFDHIQELRQAGHYITIVGQGMAASMAGILLQAGDRRVLTAESWLLIHEGSFGAVGSVAEVEDTVEWVRQIQERILNIFAARSQASGCKSPLSKTQIKNRYKRKDWWLSSDDALKHGFIDEIASALTIADSA